MEKRGVRVIGSITIENKSIRKNYIFNVIHQMVNILSPVITTPYVARVLAADGVGEYSYANSIAGIFALFGSLGISLYGQREIAANRDDMQNRSEAFWNTKVLEIMSSALCLILYVLFSLHQLNRLLFLVLSLNIVFHIFDITWLLHGMEDFKVVMMRNIIIKTAGIMLVFVCVKAKSDVAIYALIISGMGVISNLLVYPYAAKIICKPSVARIRPLHNIRVVLILFVPCVAMEVFSVDKAMIGAITNDRFESGYYEQASRLTKMAAMIVTSMGTVMIPKMSYYTERGDRKRTMEYLEKSYRFVWFLALPLSCGLFFLSAHLIPWFLGEGYDPVVRLLRIFSLFIVANGITNVTGYQFLVSTKRNKAYTVSIVIGAASNLLLNVFLIRRYGGLGAAFASVSAEFIMAFCQMWYIRKEAGVGKLILSGWKNWISVAVMSVMLFFVSGMLHPSIISLLILIGAGGIVYGISLLVLADSFFIDNLKSLLHHGT
ncbi:MAG: flippase [Lachnospiraceae bacterium]|nr:flippase [Lachnospiraceae bacterium]